MFRSRNENILDGFLAHSGHQSGRYASYWNASLFVSFPESLVESTSFHNNKAFQPKANDPLDNPFEL